MTTVRGLLIGGFDLFHIGDLHAIEAARSSCDELLVAVAGDELFTRVHGREPFVTELDRVHIVQHVRWVDQVVTIGDSDPARFWQTVDVDAVFVADDPVIEALRPIPPRVTVRDLAPIRRTGSRKLQSVLDRTWNVA